MPPTRPPAAPDSVTPAEGFYPAFPHAWRLDLKGQLDRAARGDIDVAFVGDSLTRLLADQPVWKQRYEPIPATNFGVGGDGTPQVLWRIEAGILDGYAAELVVLMVGLNNAWPGYSPADTAEGVKAVVAAVRRKQPGAKVLLLGLLPAFDARDPIRKRIAFVNDAVRSLDDGERVRFLDMGGRFVDAGGELHRELYGKDRIHLSPRGYAVWSEVMDPVMWVMLGRPGAA